MSSFNPLTIPCSAMTERQRILSLTMTKENKKSVYISMESLCNGYPMKFGRSFLSKPNDLCIHRSFSIKNHAPHGACVVSKQILPYSTIYLVVARYSLVFLISFSWPHSFSSLAIFSATNSLSSTRLSKIFLHLNIVS